MGLVLSILLCAPLTVLSQGQDGVRERADYRTVFKIDFQDHEPGRWESKYGTGPLADWGFAHVVSNTENPADKYIEHRPGFTANGGTLDSNWCGQYFTNAVAHLKPGQSLQLSLDYRQFARNSLDGVNMFDCHVTTSQGGSGNYPEKLLYFGKTTFGNRRAGFRLAQSPPLKSGACPDGCLTVALKPLEYWKPNLCINLNDIGISGLGTADADIESDELRLTYTLKYSQTNAPLESVLVVSNKVTHQSWVAESNLQNSYLARIPKLFLGINADTEMSGDEGFEIDNVECRILHETYPLDEFLTAVKASKGATLDVEGGFAPIVEPECQSGLSGLNNEALLSIPKTLKRIHDRQKQLNSELSLLPSLQEPLQFDAYGFHGGYLPALAELPENPRWTVDLQFSGGAHVHEIILVPAIDRRFSSLNNYGFPRRFRVLQVFPDGSTRVAREWVDTDCPDPGRMPLSIDMPDPSTGRFRIEVLRGSEENGKELFALDEFYAVVNQEIFKARKVDVHSGFESRPYWGKRYLTDQKTSLGLPVDVGGEGTGTSPGGDYAIIFNSPPTNPCILEVDLGANRTLGWIDLFPALPPEGILIPGYGFPGKISLEMVPETEEGKRGETIDVQTAWGRGTSGGHVVQTAWDKGNPGNNVVRLQGRGISGRWIRLILNDFPVHNGQLTFALGEINVYRFDETYPIERVHLEGFPPGAEEDVRLLMDRKSNGRPIMFLLDWLHKIEQRNRFARELSGISAEAEKLELRWWFFLKVVAIAIALLVVSGALAIALVAVIQRRRHAKALRQQITQDLHDDIGSRLSAMSLASTYLRRISKDERVHERSGKIERMAREMQVALADVLWFTNSDTDSLQELVARLSNIAEQSVRPELLKLQVVPPLAQIPDSIVGVQFKRDLMLLFKEMVNNAVKHAEASEIRVELRWDRSHLSVTVADNGRGFDVEHEHERVRARPHLGLNSMDRRAKRLGTKLSIDSQPGKGCTASLKIKV
ncbi:sensor histidine kinase [Pontiella sulfatireligans]|uniref:sensor histidine kinase n=1 Tax=Pontiella sulfatireligans TaxID=2750658 RepID=UPI00144444AA|nr:ATP-binding protein [Pontiella sulfatireligans]